MAATQHAGRLPIPRTTQDFDLSHDGLLTVTAVQKVAPHRAEDRQIMMKLYSWDLSPYSARVRMQIYAKGLTDIAIEQAPMVLTQKFHEDHPIGRLPLLEIDGEGVPES